MHESVELSAGEFFASATGVCVYVNLAGRAFRVQFDSADGPGVARGTTEVGAAEAVVVATRALEKYRTQLRPLFDRVAHELASRPGK
jgi:hypothetical protein